MKENKNYIEKESEDGPEQMVDIGVQYIYIKIIYIDCETASPYSQIMESPSFALYDCICETAEDGFH